MIALDLHSQHTGDILMALPALGGLLATGQEASILAKPRYSDCVKAEGLKFVTEAEHRAVPDYRGVHRTHAWLRHFGVEPVRMLMLQGKGDVVVISPWADSERKRWPFIFWEHLSTHLIRAGHKVRLIAPPVAKLNFSPLREVEGLDYRLGQCTHASWPEYLLDAGCVVSPDTGAVHMADAMGVPAIGLYGATPLWKFAPFWNRSHCLEADSMRDIRPGAVLAAIEKAL